jgi:hypothetical protein
MIRTLEGMCPSIAAMAEGVAAPGGSVRAGVFDDPDSPPPADPVTAPHGYVWKRAMRSWQPARRRPKPGTTRAGIGPHDGAAEQPGREATQAPAGPAGPPAPEAGRPDEDPAPGWQAEGGNAGAPNAGEPGAGDRPAFEDVPQEVKDDIAGLAGLVATPILALVQSIDPYCGGVLADNFGRALDATLPIICRSEKIVRYFSEDKSDWLLWGKLAIVLAPVGHAIAEHHIFGTVRVVTDPQTGAKHVERRQQGQQWGGPGADHLTPQPQPEYNYAA